MNSLHLPQCGQGIVPLYAWSICSCVTGEILSSIYVVWYSLDSETFHTAAKNAVVGPKAFHVPQNTDFRDSGIGNSFPKGGMPLIVR